MAVVVLGPKEMPGVAICLDTALVCAAVRCPNLIMDSVYLRCIEYSRSLDMVCNPGRSRLEGVAPWKQ